MKWSEKKKSNMELEDIIALIKNSQIIGEHHVSATQTYKNSFTGKDAISLLVKMKVWKKWNKALTLDLVMQMASIDFDIFEIKFWAVIFFFLKENVIGF